MAYISFLQNPFHMQKILTWSLLLLLSAGLSAQNCQPGWAFYRVVTLDNTGGPALTDVQVPVAVATSSWTLQAAAADLRVTSATCDPLPFYLDSLPSASTNTLWVRVPNIPAGGTVDLQVYYGATQPQTSAVDGDATFLFFDDFSADSVNLAKWQPIGEYATLAIQEGALTYASTADLPGPRFKFLRTALAFDAEAVFDFRARISNSNGFGFSSAQDTISRILFRQSGFGFDTLNQVAFMPDTVSNGYQVEGFYPLIRYPRNEFPHATIRAGVQDSLLTLTHFANLTDNSARLDTYQLTQIKMGAFHFIVSTFSAGIPVQLDYLRVRRDLPAGLMATVGDEIPLGTQSLRQALRLDLRLSPNPNTGHFSLQGLPGGGYDLVLYNAQGQAAFRQAAQVVAGQPVRVTLPALPAGIYRLVCLGTDDRVGTASLQLQAR